MTREDIEKLNAVEPYCFETGREEQWYQVGLREGLETADEHPKSPWISVKDDLPCNHEELIYSNNKNLTLFVIALVHSFAILSRMEQLDGNWHWTTDEPSYWFPIPEPPKE